MVFAECSSETLAASSANPMLHCIVAADYDKFAISLGGGEMSAYYEYSSLSSSFSVSCALAASLNMKCR